jgi:hypothetical protein
MTPLQRRLLRAQRAHAPHQFRRPGGWRERVRAWLLWLANRI